MTTNTTNVNNTNDARIFVHGGQSHMDEIWAVAILWLLRPALVGRIPLRVNELPDDFRPGTDWALDIGGVLSPDKQVFDHHQADAPEAQCAASLLVKALDPNFFEFLDRDPFPGTPSWFRVLRITDSLGPFKAKAIFGALPQDSLGPILTKIFPREPGEALKIAFPIISGWRGLFDEEVILIKEAAAVGTLDAVIEGINVVFSEMTGTRLLGHIERAHGWTPQSPGVVVFKDDRGPGLGLLRRGDHPRVDFRRAKDDPRVIFTHPNGFIAKTGSPLSVDEALDLIRAAID